MKRIILTGAPGAGKTVLIRELERLGHAVVEEAATDVIALEQARGNLRPHEQPQFIEKIMHLQLQRLNCASAPLQFHDRSLVCTAALAEFLGFPIPDALHEAILTTRGLFEPRVFSGSSISSRRPTRGRSASKTRAGSKRCTKWFIGDTVLSFRMSNLLISIRESGRFSRRSDVQVSFISGAEEGRLPFP